MAAFLRSLDELLSLSDAPLRKTSTGVGTDSHSMTDSLGSSVTKAPFDDLMGLSDSVSVTRFVAVADDREGLSDTGAVYAKALIGEETVGLTDEPPVIFKGTSTAWARTIPDTMTLQDLDRPQLQGWASTVDDTERLRDPAPTIQTSSSGGQTVEETAGIDDETPILSRSLVFDDAMGLSDPAPTVVQTHSTFFATTIEDPIGPIDNNLGDNAGFLTVSKVGILPTVLDIAYLRDSLTATVSATDFTFEGPTVEEGPAGGDPLFYYYRLTRGVTVIQDPDTTWRMVRFPTSEELAAALTVYRGGYTYDLTLAQALALNAAGFSAFVVPRHDPVTVTVAENPIP